MAFVEQKLFRSKVGKRRRIAHCASQGAQPGSISLSFCPSQRDVRMKRARFRLESAAAGRCGHAFGEHGQFGRRIDVGEQYACAVKAADCAQLHGNRRAVHLAEPRRHTRELFSRDVA